MIPFLGWVAIILVALLVVTFLLKKFVKQAQTWYVISMVRFSKPLKLFDMFNNHPRALNILTDIGLVL